MENLPAISIQEGNTVADDSVMVEGKLNYLTSADKTQFIDAKALHWFKS
jgi:hypothetical protein